MKFFLIITSLTLLSANASLSANLKIPSSENFSSPKLVINNRILAKINDKTISVLDVTKKMDVFLTRFYPQYANDVQARYQYFSSQWKEVLTQLIDSELMLLDAEKLELKVSDAEVRESILEKFGPNVMESLGKLQMSYDEARKMVHSDIIVERMTWYKINAKALQSVNPKDIKNAYQNYLVKNPPQEKWEYQVLSIRTKNEEIGKNLAAKAYDLLTVTKKPFSDVLENLKSNLLEENEVSINVSEEFQMETKSLSEAHKSVLFKLAVNSISEPIKQFSKSDQSVVYRIFHLKNHTKISPPRFSQISEKLKEELLNNAASQESKFYLEKIRSKFGYDIKSILEDIPADFHPYELKQ